MLVWGTFLWIWYVFIIIWRKIGVKGELQKRIKEQPVVTTKAMDDSMG